MILLGVDFETTGLDLDNDRIIEAGAVMWDAYDKQPLNCYNWLLHSTDMPQIQPEALAVHGITKGKLQSYGRPSHQVLTTLRSLMDEADYIVAHNGTSFDKPLFDNECARHGIEPYDRKWIDTRTDIEYPPGLVTRKLTYLAVEHGLNLQYSHRAIFDVLTMLGVLGKYDIDEVLEYYRAENVLVRAEVSYQTKDQAKERGYHYKPETKKWEKNIKDFQVNIEKEQAPFTVTILGS